MTQDEVNIKDKIDTLIVDYLTKNISSEDLAELMHWRKESPENEVYFQEMQKLWSALSSRKSSRFTMNDAEAGYREFLHRVKRRQRKEFLSRVARYAAVSAVVLAFSSISYWMGYRNDIDTSKLVQIESPEGSSARITLPDGTMVKLSSGSYITYSSSFGKENRNVTIEGKGYFEVAKNRELPFTLKSRNLEVRVLGTKFYFCDYSKDTHAFLTLTEGKVDLHGLESASGKILYPGNKAILNKSNGRITLKKLSEQELAKESIGRLSFDELPIRDVLNAIERSYGIKFEVEEDRLGEMLFYGEFNVSKMTLEQIMELISPALQMDYNIDGKTVTLN